MFSGETRIKQQRGNVYLSVVPVELIGLDSTRTRTYALLDPGSQSTLIRQDVANKLKLKTVKKNITISTIKDHGQKMKVNETSFDAASILDDSNVKIYQCFIVPETHFHMPAQIYPEDVSTLKHLQGIKLDNVNSKQIGLLIGANIPSIHFPIEVRRGDSTQPFAIKTLFGWTLFGPYGMPRSSVAINKLHMSPSDDLHDVVQRIWAEDAVSHIHDRDPAPSIEDSKCLQKLENQTTL